MADRLDMALVGCGAISGMHLMGIDESAPEIRITAAVDPVLERAKALAEKTGARPFTSLDAALSESDFDAVDLVLPHDLHEEVACQCLAAG